MARRPPALKHGLTSCNAHSPHSEDAVALAEDLLGATPREPQVIEAALDAGEAILYLRRVQKCRLLALEGRALGRATRTDAERVAALTLSEKIKHGSAAECRTIHEELRVAHEAEWKVGVAVAATVVLGLEMSERTTDLRRLSEYERRAASARRRALRRLDYEMVEAQRRAAISGKSPSRSPGMTA